MTDGVFVFLFFAGVIAAIDFNTYLFLESKEVFLKVFYYRHLLYHPMIYHLSPLPLGFLLDAFPSPVPPFHAFIIHEQETNQNQKVLITQEGGFLRGEIFITRFKNSVKEWATKICRNLLLSIEIKYFFKDRMKQAVVG